MNTSPAEIEAYLYEHIPISKAFGVTVERADTEVVLAAPFAPNINHKSTVFGGSLQAVATLAAWSLVHIHARAWAEHTEVVITHSDIDYLRPVTGDFEARAILPELAQWQRFHKAFKRHGKARTTIDVTIMDRNALAVDYSGTFALLSHSA